MPPSDASNSLSHIISEIQLLLLSGSVNWQQRALHAEQLLAVLGSIFTSKQAGVLFVYFLERKAATAWTIQCDTSIPEATVYRILKRLMVLGVIEKCTTVGRMKTKGGPRPRVYGLITCDGHDVARAIGIHRSLSNPLYRVAKVLTQQLLSEGVKEITIQQVRARVRSTNMLRFRPHEVAEAAVPMLHAEGVKVWR